MVAEAAADVVDGDTSRRIESADPWFADGEKVLARWPYIEDLLVLDWD